MTTETETPAEPLSLRDELAAAMTEAPETPITPAVAETPAQVAERARDDAGRFAKQETPAIQQPSELPTPIAGTEPAATQTIAPPVSWTATAKAKFATLDPIIQQEVLKREGDMDKGKAQWDAKASRFSALEEILAPRRERFQLAGIDEAAAVRSLFAAQDMLERSPVEALQYLARQYGVNLASLAQQPGQAAQQPMHPVIQQLASQVQALQGELSQQRNASTQAAQSQLATEIQSFAADPANLYFENVKGEMAAMLHNGAVSGLKEAYDRAVWSNPETRGLLLQAQIEAKAREAQDAARAKASAARQASGSITGSPSPGMSPASSGPASTIRDELARAFADAS